ncbi:MAG TPA: hypothetical protein VN345_09590 [Blastocatellia bacterium]|nr:hypothetical protein [Blastocatellia bacterium]
MSRRRIILVVVLSLGAGAIASVGPMRGTAHAQLPTLHISGAQLFFAGQPVDSLTVGTKVKRYTVSIIGVGFDAFAKLLVNGMKIPVLSSSNNQITARFKGLVLTPGELSLQVMNSDGEISNSVMIDVVSDPSVLSVSAVSPGTGIVGAQVTVTGVGFTATGNTVQMVNVQVPTLRGVTGPIDSADGKTLTLKIPSGICPPCVLSNPPCLAPCFTLLPGSYRLSVTNSNGLSNGVLFVVSGPVSVSSASPEVAPIGATITVTGEGFTPADNRVEFVRAADPTSRGLIAPLASPDGKTLTFNIPASLLPTCFFIGCQIPNTPVSPGSYQLSVMNSNGVSNMLPFLVTSASGPIGVWGSTGDKVKVTVTDTQIMADGLCFTGMIPQTLIADAMGNFNLTGTFSPMIGPAGIPQSAQYSGSINGTTMTLSITTSSTTLGPFTLTFGNDVLIVHPCV